MMIPAPPPKPRTLPIFCGYKPRVLYQPTLMPATLDTKPLSENGKTGMDKLKKWLDENAQWCKSTTRLENCNSPGVQYEVDCLRDEINRLATEFGFSFMPEQRFVLLVTGDGKYPYAGIKSHDGPQLVFPIKFKPGEMVSTDFGRKWVLLDSDLVYYCEKNEAAWMPVGSIALIARKPK